MQKNRFLVIAVWLFVAVFSPLASAFVGPPILVPAQPLAGQTVSVSIGVGVCDAFIERAGFPQITRNGNAIRIVLAAVHYTDPAICMYPTGTNVTPVGEFPAGSYTLQVDREYDDLFNGDIIETLGILPFTVAVPPAPPVAAPSLNAFGLAGLFAALLVAGASALVCELPFRELRSARFNRARRRRASQSAVCVHPYDTSR